MPTIVISGAGSGIGHTFLKFLASDENNTLHALDISFPDKISGVPAKVHEHTIDTSSQSSVDSFVKSLDGQPVDLFIHSAAIRGLVPAITEKEKDPSAAETMEVMDSNTMMKTLQINAVGSFLLIRALIPNLKAAKQGAKVVVMGSRMGSIASNHDGSKYAYRASKAALNALVKSFSIDVPEVCFTIVHPGRVESRMVPTMREEGAIDAEDAVKMMMPMIEGFGKKDTGKFYSREGDEIPW